MQKISGNLMVRRIIVVQGVGGVSTPFKWVLKTYRHNPCNRYNIDVFQEGGGVMAKESINIIA